MSYPSEERLEKAVLVALHFAARSRGQVIKATQVEDAVDDIANEFLKNGTIELPALTDGVGE